MAQDSWSLPDSDDGRPDEKDDAMSADGGGAGEDDDDCDEERYNTWRAHWKYLYSTIVVERADAPSNTVAWLPDVASKQHTIESRIVASTCGTRKQHYVTIFKVRLPCRTDDLPWLPGYDESTGELGGKGCGPAIRLDAECRFYHPGPVTALKLWACNPSVYVTRSTEPTVNVFNSLKHKWAKKKPPRPDPKALEIEAEAPPQLRARRTAALQEQAKYEEWEQHEDPDCEPDLVLKGLSSPGDALDVSNSADGYVAAGGEDGRFVLWKLSDAEKGSGELEGMASVPADRQPVPGSDVSFMQFSPAQPTLLLGGGSKRALWLADVRDPLNPQRLRPFDGEGGARDLLSAAWSLHVPTMLAVGDSTGDVHVLDIRNAAQPLFTLSGHTKEVYSIDWSPHQPSVLASGGNDCNVLLWDLRGRDSECHPAYAGDKEAGHTPPPLELFFKHTGHSDEVGQVSWSFDPELRGTLASVDLDAEEPTVQVWRPRNNYWVDA